MKKKVGAKSRSRSTEISKDSLTESSSASILDLIKNLQTGGKLKDFGPTVKYFAAIKLLEIVGSQAMDTINKILVALETALNDTAMKNLIVAALRAGKEELDLRFVQAAHKEGVKVRKIACALSIKLKD